MANHFLRDLTVRVGAAFEAEDRLILGSGVVRGEPGGLLRLNNERYYQFIMWRAVLSSWHAKVEEKYHDLVIFDPSARDKHLAVFEMKNWMSPTGIPEIPRIHSDIAKLGMSDAPNTALMIFSANDRGAMNDQLQFFEQRVFSGVPQPQRATYCFPTVSPYKPTVASEFWIAVWPIKAGALFAQ